jgi:hypothetical protein
MLEDIPHYNMGSDGYHQPDWQNTITSLFPHSDLTHSFLCQMD